MSDNMNLVAHVRRTEKGLSKMQIRLPISMRAGMAELSKRLGISQLALVRSALAAFLVANEAPVVPLVAPEVIAEAQPEEATEAQTPAPPPQAATEANAARAARHRSKLLSRKPTETRKPRTKQANS